MAFQKKQVHTKAGEGRLIKEYFTEAI